MSSSLWLISVYPNRYQHSSTVQILL